MQNKIIKRLIVGIILSISCSFSVQASENEKNMNVVVYSEDGSVLLPMGEGKSSDRQDSYARGTIISSAFASITNSGGGKIEILLETLAHRQCDKIRHVGYLERWIEEDQDYEQVARYEFIEYASDHPDERFTALTSLLVIEDQPTGYYYRLRGTHNVYVDGTTEGLSTRTNGVMITK